MTAIEEPTIRALLSEKPEIQRKLYVNGFLISNELFEIKSDYPFYGNWNVKRIRGFYLFAHKDTKAELIDDGENTLFFIGHAVDPFLKLYREHEILEKLASALRIGTKEYYYVLNNLTGVFCTGIISNKGICFTNDCAGMQIVYYGSINGSIVISSHSKLAGDLLGLEQTEYIRRLVSSRFYHYMGTWLPGDLSPYKEFIRLVPNHSVFISEYGSIEISRFFPENAIIEEKEDEHQKTISWLADTLHKTLELYTKKWSESKIAISVTGGRDSTTTLACANGLQDKFAFFSYISNESERADAIAAEQICRYLGLEHSTYSIPFEDSAFINDDLKAFSCVLECNSGCIGKNNSNDIRKRLFFIQNPKYDVEIKSWVNELGRGSQYVKYNKKRFPKKPKASYCRALHKIYVSPRLIHETDQVFSQYLKKYYAPDVFDKAPWMELFWWEFCWSGGEGLFLTAEHRVSSEIAIPYNNRRYVAEMLRVPLDKRRCDVIPNDIIDLADRRINESGVLVKNVKHTDIRAFLMRMYLEIFSKVRF